MTIYVYIYDYPNNDVAFNASHLCILAQNELLDRAYANGMAALGKYEGGTKSSAAADSNFVAQHAY